MTIDNHYLNDLLPMKRMQNLQDRVMIKFCRLLELKLSSDVLSKDVFLILFRAIDSLFRAIDFIYWLLTQSP